MTSKNIGKLAAALRCSVGPYSEKNDCSECPYRLLEEATEDYPLPFPDGNVEIDGVAYWESCDTDRMILDAAEILEDIINGEVRDMSEMTYRFPEILKELIDKSGVTPYKLGTILGIGENTLYRHLRGRATPSMELLDKLSKYFNVSADYLLYGESSCYKCFNDFICWEEGTNDEGL